MRRISQETGSWLLSAVVLAALLAALALGATTRRWMPATAFAAFWFATATYIVAGRAALRRRASRLATASVRLGVRLNRPAWIPLVESFYVLTVAGALGVAGAAVGLPQVAVGVALSLVLMAAVYTGFLFKTSVDLTFEPSVLRVHLPGAHFELPWSSIVDVVLTGPPNARDVNLLVGAPRQLFETLVPSTPRTQRALHLLLALGRPPDQAIALSGWAAGWDAAALARVVREMKGAPGPGPN